jgi:hypothetical protein
VNRSHSILDHHAAQLEECLRKPEEGGEGLGFVEVANRLKAQGVATSKTAVHRWWQNRAPQRVLERIHVGRQATDLIAKEFAENPAPHVATIIAWLKNLVMTRAANDEDFDPQATVALIKPVLEWAKIEEHREDRALEIQKFAQAMKSRIEAGLDELAKAFEASPEAMQLYRRAREIVAQQSTGG